MKRIRSHLVGIDQGSVLMFSDYEDGGAMWTGHGKRELRRHCHFAEPFAAPPVVHVTLSMWDMDQKSNQRADLTADRITEAGFDLVFRTWGDTRVARVRASWLALGQSDGMDEDWTMY